MFSDLHIREVLRGQYEVLTSFEVLYVPLIKGSWEADLCLPLGI